MSNTNNLTVKSECKKAIKQVFIPAFTVTRLRSCTAYVYNTPDYFVLRSYNTFVACINKHTGIGYDQLRVVYGYTATSAQHIRKFFTDYNANKIYTAY